MEGHPTRPGAGDCGEDSGAALGEAVQVRLVVKRRAELGPALPDVPELAVLGAVERYVDGRDAGRAWRGVGTALVVVAQVDDRPNAVLGERRPSRGGQPVERVTTDDGAPTRHAAVRRGQAAEVAHVEAAVPVEMALRDGAHARHPRMIT